MKRHIWVDDFPNFPLNVGYMLVSSLGGYKVSHIAPEVWTRNEKTLEDSDSQMHGWGAIAKQKKQRKEIETRKNTFWKKMMVYVYMTRVFFSLIWSSVNRFFLCAVCSIFRVVKHEYSDTGHKLLTDLIGLENRSLNIILVLVPKVPRAWVPYLLFRGCRKMYLPCN